MNLEVNLTKRVRTGTGLRYCPVVMAGNGRVKPDMVLTNGKPERHPEGSYYLEWRNGSKRIRLSVGKDAAAADAQRQRKEYELRAPIHNVPVVVPEKKRPQISSRSSRNIPRRDQAHEETEDS